MEAAKKTTNPSPVAPVTSTVANTNAEAPHLFHAAYLATAAERAALGPTDLLPVNLDVKAVTNMVLAALPRVWSLRDDIVAKLPSVDIQRFDDLGTYAKALAYAQTVFVAAATPTEALPELGARAIELRRLLLADATALTNHGLLAVEPLNEVSNGTGYLAVAYDLGKLVRMLRERWIDIASNSAIETSDLDEAEQLFERITLAHAERSRQPQLTSTAGDERQRAYTLLVRAYDSARSAATFLRWDTDDADDFVPSLWTGRGGRGRGNDGAANEKPDAPDPAAVAEHNHPEAPDAEPGMPGG